jgi:hypothetical protein
LIHGARELAQNFPRRSQDEKQNENVIRKQSELVLSFNQSSIEHRYTLCGS